MKRIITTVAIAALALTTTGCEKFDNCDQLRLKFPHGVGMPNAVDSTSGTPVTTFKADEIYYKFNEHLDRDGDKIACEQA